MAVTYYVALPFMRTDDGTAPGEAQECQSEAAAIRRGRRNVTRSCQCRGCRIQACRRSERWRVFGRGRTEKVRRCAGRFERAVTTVLVLLMTGIATAGFAFRRPILVGSSTSSASPVSSRTTAMQRFGSDGSNSGHGGCALETALLTPKRNWWWPIISYQLHWREQT